MDLSLQKRLASQVLKCSPKRVYFAADRTEEIKEAITRMDIKGLVADGAIVKKQATGSSRVRARKIAKQKSKGLRSGMGRRKAKKTTRAGGKSVWVAKVRVQRGFIKLLREKAIVTKQVYNDLARKVKGGFFRSKRHIKVFIEERSLVQKK